MMASGWKHDINQNCSYISPGNVDIQKKKKKNSAHTTFFSEASSGILLNHGVFRGKKQLGKRRLQYCCYTCSCSMTKTPAGTTSSLTGIWFVYYSVFNAAPVFFLIDYPMAEFDKRAFKQEQLCASLVSCERWI